MEVGGKKMDINHDIEQFLQNKKILVTGATGFKGWLLVVKYTRC